MLYLFAGNRLGDLVVEAASEEEARVKAEAYVAEQARLDKIRSDWYAEYQRRVEEAVGERDEFAWARESVASRRIAAEMGYAPDGGNGPVELDGRPPEPVGELYVVPECLG